jgi:putative restriction endonuclease
MAFTDVTRSAVLAAIKEFDSLGRDSFLAKYGFHPARSFYLVHNSKYYDSKAIVGAAHGKLATAAVPLKPAEFNGGAATVARLLRSLGFEVIDESAPNLGEGASVGIRYWWVNNKQTYKHEVPGNYLWSPITKANGARSVFYDNMQRARQGDIVFAFADALIRAVGVVEAPALFLPKPSEFGAAGNAWGNEGWKLPVRFFELSMPLRPKDHMAELAQLLPAKYSPIQGTGDGNQGAYLAEIPETMASALMYLLGKQWDAIHRALALPEAFADSMRDEAEASVSAAIKNRTDIGETQKLQLVQSRRGQGVYRKNLEGFEKACRLTGLSDLQHLRASHIKPWRASTDYEKLDGNNGLLLSPHVDHLFDRGFISAANDGKLLVSSMLGADTLGRWGIDALTELGPFRPEQISYLEFHREYVFKS